MTVVDLGVCVGKGGGVSVVSLRNSHSPDNTTDLWLFQSHSNTYGILIAYVYVCWPLSSNQSFIGILLAT